MPCCSSTPPTPKPNAFGRRFWRHGEEIHRRATARKGLAKDTPTTYTRERLLVALAFAHKERKEYAQAITTFAGVVETSTPYKRYACGEFAYLVWWHRPDWMDKGFEAAKQAVELSPKNSGYRTGIWAAAVGRTIRRFRRRGAGGPDAAHR